MTDRDIQKDRLKEIVKDSLMKHIDKTCSLAENITNDLLANGVTVPKYKVGDTVWYITGIHRTIVKSAVVEQIIMGCNGVSDLFVKNDMGGYFENSADIFYKTKEEAEQVLAERSGNNEMSV